MKLTPQIATIIGVSLLGLARRAGGSRGIPEEEIKTTLKPGLQLYRYWGKYDLIYPVNIYDESIGAADPQDVDEWGEWEWRDPEERLEFTAKFGIDSSMLDSVTIYGRWPTINGIVDYLQSSDGEYDLESEVREGGYFDVAEEDPWFKAWWVDTKLDEEQAIKLLWDTEKEQLKKEIEARAEDDGSSVEEARDEVEQEHLSLMEEWIQSGVIEPDIDPSWEDIVERYGVHQILMLEDDPDGLSSKRLIERYRDKVAGEPFRFVLYSVFPNLGRTDLHDLLAWFLNDEIYGDVSQVTDWYVEPVKSQEKLRSQSVASNRPLPRRI